MPDKLAGTHSWAFGGFVDIVSRDRWSSLDRPVGGRLHRRSRSAGAVGAIVYAVVQAVLALPGWSWSLLNHGGPLALVLLAVVPLAPAVAAGSAYGRRTRV